MSRDPFEFLLTDPAEGRNEPSYRGLFVFPLWDGEINNHRFVIAEMHQAYDGGMREFTCPVTHECIGCCGVKFANERVAHISGDYEWGIRTTLDTIPGGAWKYKA